MKKTSLFFIIALVLGHLISCNKNKDDEGRPIMNIPPSAQLNIQLKFDSLQIRLDNFGNISTVPGGHAAQSPKFNKIYIGLIELLSDSTTPYGQGVVLMNNYSGINWNDTGYICCNNVFQDGYVIKCSIDTSNIPNTFKYIRINFVYENFDVSYKFNGITYNGSVAAFLAPKTLAYNYSVGDSSFTNYSLKTNGEWELEVDTPGYGIILHGTSITTHPNVLYSTQQSPTNSCIVTCEINPNIHIDESDSLQLKILISTNKSFEWIENSDPNFFEPFDGDTIVDVGIRGVNLIVQ